MNDTLPRCSGESCGSCLTASGGIRHDGGGVKVVDSDRADVLLKRRRTSKIPNSSSFMVENDSENLIGEKER